MPDFTKKVLLGRDVSFRMRGFSISATGQLVYDTIYGYQSLRGRCERAEKRHRRMAEQIIVLDSVTVHNVGYILDWSLTLTAVKLSAVLPGDDAGQVADPLETIFNAFEHLQVELTLPKTVSTYWGFMEENGLPIDRNRNIEALTLIPIDLGPSFANPLILPVT